MAQRTKTAQPRRRHNAGNAGNSGLLQFSFTEGLTPEMLANLKAWMAINRNRRRKDWILPASGSLKEAPPAELVAAALGAQPAGLDRRPGSAGPLVGRCGAVKPCES